MQTFPSAGLAPNVARKDVLHLSESAPELWINAGGLMSRWAMLCMCETIMRAGMTQLFFERIAPVEAKIAHDSTMKYNYCNRFI